MQRAPARVGSDERHRRVSCRSRWIPTSRTNGTRPSRRRRSSIELVDRPNVYVKIPATAPGVGAIEDSIAAGRAINVTLIFSLERYAEVVEAYIRGLERLVATGGDPTHVVSVASFFVSRVDTKADRRLGEIGRTDLQGRLAVDNAKLAYEHYPGLSPVRVGKRWPPPELARSAACGRRPRRRIRRIATSSTSRSSSGRTR